MINRDAWLKALQEAAYPPVNDDPDALSVLEFGAVVGLSRAQAAKRLDQMVEKGKAIRTTKMIQRRRGAGTQRVSAFRLVKD